MKNCFSKLFIFLFFLGVSDLQLKAQMLPVVKSPDGKIEVSVSLSAGLLSYSVSVQNKMVLKPSTLGIVRQDADLSKELILLSSTPVQKVTDNYKMLYAKKRNISYQANKKTYHLRNAKNALLDVIFHVSNDGVAFRYFFPGKSSDVKYIKQEISSFQFDTAARAWLQPMQVAKTGFEQTNPAYEANYQQNISVTANPPKPGWIYPALFRYNDTWLLITEANLDSSYCATRLQSSESNGKFTVEFPDPREVIKDKNLLPRSRLPFYSPWRVITIGGLNTIIESTLGTDLAAPSIKMNTAFVKPGKSSWSWIMSKDDFIVYDEQIKYIDFAADMKWQYCLIDANWDQKIGYEKVKQLVDYAAKKNVNILLWYNSAGDWNTVKMTPKDKMFTHESRVAEFKRIRDMGVKGAKIDFFGGDGQSVIKYYHEILKDAADYQMLVNFHGATLPRGWSRTYPHLVTTEAVKGFEMITFNQSDANVEPTHCAMLPFTRNAFDPMDFTPTNLYSIPTRSKRKTTSGYELALSIIFLSGIQHFAESPEGMTHVSAPAKEFLRTLPDSWDDVKFIQGFPGKDVVLARKFANKWYIAGINGDSTQKTFDLDLSQFKMKQGQLLIDGPENASFVEEQLAFPADLKKKITVKANGGFVLVLQ